MTYLIGLVVLCSELHGLVPLVQADADVNGAADLVALKTILI